MPNLSNDRRVHELHDRHERINVDREVSAPLLIGAVNLGGFFLRWTQGRRLICRLLAGRSVARALSCPASHTPILQCITVEVGCKRNLKELLIALLMGNMEW